MKRLLVVVAALAFAPAALAAKTITVHGTGIITTVPTKAVFTFGVSSVGATARAALASNSALMNKVIAALESNGVKEADIQTAQLSLQANTSPNGSKILNYTASNSVSAEMPVASAGATIDAAVRAGANQLSGPSLSSADTTTLSRRALKAAVADARARAQAVAAAAGVRLGGVLSVSEQTNSVVPYAAGPLVGAKAASTPVQGGTLQTEADVTVVFAIA